MESVGNVKEIFWKYMCMHRNIIKFTSIYNKGQLPVSEEESFITQDVEFVGDPLHLLSLFKENSLHSSLTEDSLYHSYCY